MHDEEEGTVIDAGQSCAETSAEPLFFMFACDEIGFRLPLHTEGRIGQHVIELVAREPVIGEAVAKGDMFDVLAFDHHVRPADGVGLGVVILAENLQAGVWIKLAHIVLSYGQHSACPAGRVIESLYDSFGGEDVAIRHK